MNAHRQDFGAKFHYTYHNGASVVVILHLLLLNQISLLAVVIINSVYVTGDPRLFILLFFNGITECFL